MGIKKFIKSVTQSLDVEKIKKSSKKKSLKILIKKLEERRIQILSDNEQDKNTKIKEKLEIINLHIKKGKKILEKLNQDKDSKNTKG
jgi:gamma-glutamyl phosphate reductase